MKYDKILHLQPQPSQSKQASHLLNITSLSSLLPKESSFDQPPTSREKNRGNHRHRNETSEKMRLIDSDSSYAYIFSYLRP